MKKKVLHKIYGIIVLCVTKKEIALKEKLDLHAMEYIKNNVQQLKNPIFINHHSHHNCFHHHPISSIFRL